MIQDIIDYLKYFFTGEEASSSTQSKRSKKPNKSKKSKKAWKSYLPDWEKRKYTVLKLQVQEELLSYYLHSMPNLREESKEQQFWVQNEIEFYKNGLEKTRKRIVKLSSVEPDDLAKPTDETMAELRDLFKEKEIKALFERFMAEISTSTYEDGEMEKAIILLSGRFNRLMKDGDSGITSFSEFKKTEGQILLAILRLLKELHGYRWRRGIRE